MQWLNEIRAANNQFQQQIEVDHLPVERAPCPYAVITCMDPRINLEAIGIPQFLESGASMSQVRVMRTIGGMHEERSAVIGIHLAGFREIVVLMHTDCGCCLAHNKVDAISSNMESSLSPDKLLEAQKIIGGPLRENLREWLHTFDDPRVAVRQEVAAISASPFTPENIVVHGLVYDLATGSVEVIVDGYEN